MTTTAGENKAIVRQLDQAGDEIDKQAAMEVLADEIHIVGPGYSQRLTKEEWWEEATWMDEAFPDWETTVEHMIAEGDMVAVRDNFSATHSGEYTGVPTGKEVTGEGHSHYRIKDGQITHIWTVWSEGELWQTLGLYPESPVKGRIQNQLLEVLLRVLRHNISNDLNAINGLAEMIAGGDAPAQDYAERIQDQATDLQATAEKVREVERAIVHESQTDTVHLAKLLGSILAEQRNLHPEAEIDVTIPEKDVAITSDQSVLSMVVEEAIENAILHTDATDPEIKVELLPADDDDHVATIAVADNGPGIPDHELKPVERGSEDPLEHGSGIGLWAIKWGVKQLAGDVEFEENEPTGSVVKMHLGEMD